MKMAKSHDGLDRRSSFRRECKTKVCPLEAVRLTDGRSSRESQGSGLGVRSFNETFDGEGLGSAAAFVELGGLDALVKGDRWVAGMANARARVDIGDWVRGEERGSDFEMPQRSQGQIFTVSVSSH